MRVESSGKPDAWKLARPVWGWGRGAIPRPTPRNDCDIGGSGTFSPWATPPGGLSPGRRKTKLLPQDGQRPLLPSFSSETR